MTDRNTVIPWFKSSGESLPLYSSSSVENAYPARVLVNFNKTVKITNTTGVTIRIDGVSATISSVTGSGTNTLTFYISPAIVYGDLVDFQYNATTGNITNSGTTKIASITLKTVTNNVEASVYDTYESQYYPTYSIPETIPGTHIYYVDTDNISASNANPGTESLPWKTITYALTQIPRGSGAAADYTIVIREGIYYEYSLQINSLSNNLNGTSGHPFTLMAYPGDRVIISALKILSTANGYTWSSVGSDVYKTTVTGTVPYNSALGAYGELQRIYSTNKITRLPFSRYPAKGWYKIEGCNNTTHTFNDSKLASIDPTLVSGSLMHGFFASIDYVGYPDITNCVTSSGIATVTVDTTTTLTYTLSGGYYTADLYFLMNKPDWITDSGQWCFVEGSGTYDIYYKPYVSISDDVVGLPQGSVILNINAVSYVDIIGLEITGCLTDGIDIYGSNNIRVFNCTEHNNISLGIYIRASHDVIIAKQLAYKNQSGINIRESYNVLLDIAELGHNLEDNYRIMYTSYDITTRNAYIHHATDKGHPDNVQTYLTTYRLTFKDCLFLCAAQAFMCENLPFSIKFSNCAIIGARSQMLNISYYLELLNCTLWGSYYAMVAAGTWEDTIFKDNIFKMGYKNFIYGNTNATYEARLSSDYNLFYSGYGLTNYDKVFYSHVNYQRTLAELYVDTGHEEHSQFANPIFTSMPDYYIATTRDYLDIHTSSGCVLLTSEANEWLTTGDHVEINFDGVDRVVQTKASYDARSFQITFSPALDSYPYRTVFVCKWNSGVSSMDCTLESSSPGLTMSSTGGRVGCTLNLTDYKNGDFDGDDIRDVPFINFE
jgi:hypothetical protein